MTSRGIEDTVVLTLKTLAMDAVERAASGHPGMPMGMADAATVLWLRHLVVDPTAPSFFARDRFVLSAGHGSMLLYGLLHLAGFDLPLRELQRFRQLGSRTPGHPEHGLTPGVETTTGPLGQGFANGVGMAMAAAHLAARYNRPGFPMVDHTVYAICSDGDLHEGISHEAASIAGHLGLGRLVYLYDDNRITIDGPTSLHTSEDTAARFVAYGWHVATVDGHDREAVDLAIRAARAETARPSLIVCRTHIGHGSPHKQDSEEAHGAPLGAEEVRLTKRALGWPEDAEFLVPEEARSAFDVLRARGAERRQAWHAMFVKYADAHPELARELHQALEGDGLPADLDSRLPSFEGVAKEATRASSGKVINALSPHLPGLWGGSADLAVSNQTLVKGAPAASRQNLAGRNLHFGVREHAMGAILTGMALHGGIIPYGGTFLTFTDYMRPAIRLAALMGQRVIYVLTHDSLFLGEDGPTHQAVEHAMALRLIPNLHVMRPADGRETAAAWFHALRRCQGPTAILLSRQGLPQLPGTLNALEGVGRGGYVVHGGAARPDLVLIGTGSELHLCTGAAKDLESDGLAVRVVSMVSAERFLAEPQSYRDQVLPPDCPARVSVEAGRTFGWERFVGPQGRSVGLDRFGESAPGGALAEHFGFTVAQVVKTAREVIPR
jgi:transketolase